MCLIKSKCVFPSRIVWIYRYCFYFAHFARLETIKTTITTKKHQIWQKSHEHAIVNRRTRLLMSFANEHKKNINRHNYMERSVFCEWEIDSWIELAFIDALNMIIFLLFFCLHHVFQFSKNHVIMQLVAFLLFDFNVLLGLSGSNNINKTRIKNK